MSEPEGQFDTMVAEANDPGNWVPRKTERETTVAEVDQAFMIYKVTRDKYEAASKEKAFFHDELEKSENQLIYMLEKIGKTKYHNDELGAVLTYTKYNFKVPKELTSKKEFFEWIRGKHGEETLMGLLSINYNSLNSFVNAEKETDSTIEIPGLDAPTGEKKLRFTPKK